MMQPTNKKMKADDSNKENNDGPNNQYNITINLTDGVINAPYTLFNR